MAESRAGYTVLRGFEHVRLEDCEVLDVALGPGAAQLELDVALGPGHPLHGAGRRPGVVTFTGVTWSTWRHPEGARAAGIECWTVAGREHHLVGSFGVLDLVADEVLLILSGAAATDPDLLVALRAEAALERAQRSTGASDGVLEAAIVIVERGAVTEREAATLRSVVSDSWSSAAPLSERLLAWVSRARA